MQEKPKKEKAVTITTTIPRDVYDEIKSLHTHYNELIFMGLESRKKTPHIIERLNEVEEQNEKLRTKLSNITLKLWEIEEEKRKINGATTP